MPKKDQLLNLSSSARDILAGEITLKPFFWPCRQQILMVADGGIAFDTGGFALSKVLSILENNPEWWAKFNITCAHRGGTPGTTATVPTEQGATRQVLQGFRFTQTGFGINGYHQVWLFGILPGNGGVYDPNSANSLSTQELEILSRWMDEQRGGVFATGDHEELGANLCAKVPRVRSMRRWTNAQGVPPVGGQNRHDTLVTGANMSIESTDETDRYPMTIDPTYYSLASWHPFVHRSAPHPILCGTDGVITILPDHPHEGDVVEPADLGQTFSFGSYTNKPEYPIVAGHQPRPQVIAEARVLPVHKQPGASGPGHKGPANAKDFGVIGAYDGHGANVGRVAVDSTWLTGST